MEPTTKLPIRLAWLRLRQSFTHTTTGGDWALALPETARHNLHWFFFDGFYASASDSILVTYFVVYLLALGAKESQIGLMNSLTNLMAAIILLPGAMLVERIGRRKQIVVFGGGGISRFIILLWILLPLVLKGHALVYVIIAFSITRDTFAYLSYPAWVSLLADIVPLEGRGRYFGSRNFYMGVVGILITLLVGELITRMAKPLGFQLALGLAFIIGMISTYSYSRIKDPYGMTVREPGVSLNLGQVLHHLGSQRAFLVFSGVAILWNFSLNIAGPFFTVYQVQNLKSTVAMVGITTITSSISSMVFQRKLGALADRWGPRRMILISGLLIPILPFSWVFINAPWQIIPVNILGGALWGAYSLAALNYLLEITPSDQMARYSALYQIVVTLALAVGAAVGGLIVTQIGYRAIFLCSGIGRLISAILFARLVRAPVRALQVGETPPSGSLPDEVNPKEGVAHT